MMQIVVKTYPNIGKTQSHYLHAYDSNGELIDIIDVEMNGTQVKHIKSILP